MGDTLATLPLSWNEGNQPQWEGSFNLPLLSGNAPIATNTIFQTQSNAAAPRSEPLPWMLIVVAIILVIFLGHS